MSQWYYVDGNNERKGPVDDAVLVALWRTGSARLDTLVWREGEGSWRPLREFHDDLGLGGASSPAPPPLPHDPVPARPPMQASGSPRSGMSGCLIALIVAAVLLVPGTAILAAIALPAYQDYTLRAKIASAMAAAAPLKGAVTAYLDGHDRCPTDDDLGRATTEELVQGHIARVTLGEFESRLCGIELRLDGTGNGSVDGKALWFELQANDGTWQCSSEIQDRYLPQDCRG